MRQTHGVTGTGWGKKGKEETTRQDTKHVDVTRQKWKEQIWKEEMEGTNLRMMEGTHQSTWSRRSDQMGGSPRGP